MAEKNQCCIVSCNNSYRKKKTEKCRLFAPPLTNKKLCQQWRYSIYPQKFTLTNNTKFCQDHFEEECFIKGIYGPGPDGNQVLMSEFKKWRLTDTAFPSLNLGKY